MVLVRRLLLFKYLSQISIPVVFTLHHSILLALSLFHVTDFSLTVLTLAFNI